MSTPKFRLQFKGPNTRGRWATCYPDSNESFALFDTRAKAERGLKRAQNHPQNYQQRTKYRIVAVFMCAICKQEHPVSMASDPDFIEGDALLCRPCVDQQMSEYDAPVQS